MSDCITVTQYVTIDSALEAAREKAERANQIVVAVPALLGNRRIGFVRVTPDDALPYEYLGELLEDDAAGVAPWYVYPTGLVLPAMQVNWFWWVPEQRWTLRLGTAEQVVRFCQRQDIDARTVQCEHVDNIHGTCAFVAGDRFATGDRRDWRMIQARPFPAWALPPGSFWRN